MELKTFIPLNSKNLARLLPDNEVIANQLMQELADGVPTPASSKITSFRVEQKIMDMTSSSSLDVGGFANGESTIKRFQTRYLVVMFSDQYEEVAIPGGGVIRKRLGYGFGFTLNVSDIQTKLNINYAIIAASAALNLAKVGYELEVKGVVTPALVANMPGKTGDFSKDIYKQLQKFVKAAKDEMKNQPIDRLYPIEIFKVIPTKAETSDAKSMYFAVKKIAGGLKLREAIDEARKVGRGINENVIQFMYSYFGFTTAYASGTSEQQQNARRWITGKYNKVENLAGQNDSWVIIDPAVKDGKFVALSQLPEAEKYKPHPIPADWKTMVKATYDKFDYVSADFSSSFKLASIIDTSLKLNTQTISRDIWMYVDVSQGAANGNKIIETRYGVGIRMTVRVSRKEFGIDVTYANVGAACELGQTNAEFEISGFGLSDKTLLEVLPGPVDINQESMNVIEGAFQAIKAKFANMSIDDLTPQPFMVRVSEPDRIDPTLESQAYSFSMGQIADKCTLEEAINQGQNYGLKRADIEKAYKDIGITDPGDKPSYSQRGEAREWLSFGE